MGLDDQQSQSEDTTGSGNSSLEGDDLLCGSTSGVHDTFDQQQQLLVLELSGTLTI